MPKISPDRFVVEDTPGTGGATPTRTQFVSDVGGLSQFGVNIEELPPGAWSSLAHWHSAEDELVYVLEGEVTLLEDGVATVLRAGDAATFRAGDPVAHCLVNRGTSPTRCLVIGTRAPVDRITYPGKQRVCLRDRAVAHDVWTDLEGRPASNPYAAL